MVIQKAGLTVEVDLQEVGLHLLLLMQVSQHTLEQLQINKQTQTSDISSFTFSTSCSSILFLLGAHCALPRPSGANDQH